MWSAGEIAAIIAAFGGLRGLEGILAALWKAYSEKGRNRREESDKLSGQLDAQIKRNDALRSKVRVLERHAALLERMLISAECVDPAEIPAWPQVADTGEIRSV